MDPDAIPRKTFSTIHGHSEAVLLAIDLTNDPATFMDLMIKVRLNELAAFSNAHFDDTLVYRKIFEDKLKYLKTVVKKFRKRELYGKLF